MTLQLTSSQTRSRVATEPGSLEARTTRRAPESGAPQWFAMAGMATVSMTGVRVAGWTASDLFFLAASMVIVLRLLTGTRRNLAPVIARQSSPGVLIGLTVLSVGALLATVVRAVDPTGSALVLVRIWYITIVWFWTLRSVTNSLQMFRRLLLAAVVGALVNASVGILQDLTGANAGAPGWGRSLGLCDHYNDLGLAVGSVIPILAVWRRPGTTGPRGDVLRIVGLLVLMGGLASSGSLSAMGGAVIGTIVALLAPRFAGPRRRRRHSAVPLLATLAAVAVVVSGVVDLSVQDRISDLTAGDSPTTDSAASRAGQAEAALAGVIESPVIGAGLDLQSGLVDYDTGTNKVHNFYVRIMYEAGVLGLLGLGLILFMIARQTGQLLRVTRAGPLLWLPASLLGALATVLAAALFGAVQYARIVWLPMALVSALYGLARSGGMQDAMTTNQDGSARPTSARSSGTRDSSIDAHRAGVN